MGRPYLWMFMLRSNDAMPRVVTAVMFGFVDRCRAWYGKQRVPGIWSLSTTVNFKLKQKMQTWSYRLRRNPRMCLEQAPLMNTSRSAQPTRSRRERLCCVPPRGAKALRRGKNSE